MSFSDTEPGPARWIRLRMGILCGLLGLGLGLLVSAAFTLMVRDGSVWRDMAESQRQRRLHVAPKRGGVYDRNGSALAVSVEVPSVSLDAAELLRGVAPENVSQVAHAVAQKLASILKLELETVEKKILARRRFTWLKRQISAQEADQIRALSEPFADGRLRGIMVEGEGRRYYPRRELAGGLLGFVAPDGEGKDGIEYTLNSELKGQAEQLRGLRDRSGRLIFSEGVNSDELALAGHNLYLTLDQGIQYVAERELASAVRTFEAKGGSVIVLDPHTGEILALASYPTYNPNDYAESEPGERRVRAVTDAFEPGSTSKVFTIAAALAEGTLSPTQKLFCEKGSMRVGGATIRDTHPSEWLSVTQILQVSSNICAAKIGLGLGEAKLHAGLQRFGFGAETGILLPGEATGVLRPRARAWYPLETATASFGQGISVTALQLTLAFAAIANGGELMEPILIKRVTTGAGELLREIVPHVRRRVLPRSVAKTLAEMLVSVTEGEGTGVEAAILGYRVAGKTATAQKTDSLTGRYSGDRFMPSFVGFVPADRPALVVGVTVDEPMVEHTGGAVAAPVFRRVAQMSLKYRGLTPSGTERADLGALAQSQGPARAPSHPLPQTDSSRPSEPMPAGLGSGPVPAGKVRLPNLTGLPARQALKTALELGLLPELRGTGLLLRQNPAPGELLDRGSRLVLIFEPAS